ncbi:MAG: hypothetical protein IKW57_03935 [Alphaproteobacteria bacterium]|nr:hypothetical protein [Alphaproteobacteria bacterium]
MKFFQTLRYKLFGGANTKQTRPRELNPWEQFRCYDSGQLSPAAMRETHADFFLHAMYEKLARQSYVSFTDKMMSGICIEFEVPWHTFHPDTIIYKQGEMYLSCLFNNVCIATFPPEQDKLIRTAILHFIHRCKTYDMQEPRINWLLRPMSIQDELPIPAQQLVNRFTEYVNDWHKHTPLSTPVLCDGCSRCCRLGKNVYERNMTDDEFIRTDYVPTINWFLADKFYDQTGTLVSADVGKLGTLYMPASVIAKRCPLYGKQKQR